MLQLQVEIIDVNEVPVCDPNTYEAYIYEKLVRMILNMIKSIMW